MTSLKVLKSSIFVNFTNSCTRLNLWSFSYLKQDPSIFLSTRLLLSFVLFLGFVVLYLQRTNMSLAIVCMVNASDVEFDPSTNTTHLKPGKFNWSRTTQGFLLSAYFYGYILTQIISGWLSLKFGPKVILGIGVLGGSIASVLSAPAAMINVNLLIALRVVEGLFIVTIQKRNK
jgi:MFS family permease